MAAFYFNNLSTKEIEAAIIEGNPKAFKQLKGLYFSLINKLITSMNGDRTGEDAKDIFQETLIVLHKNLKEKKVRLIKDEKGVLLIRKINSHSTNESKLSSYLYGIARNIWMNSPQNLINNNEVNYLEANNVSLYISKNESYKADIYPEKKYIFKALKKLSNKCRLIIVLKKKSKLSHSEISELLNITHGSCRNLFAACWKKFMVNIRKNISVEIETDVPVLPSDAFQLQLKKIPFLNEIISFLLDVKSNTARPSTSSKERNRALEKVFRKLDTEEKLLLILYFVCLENISSISGLLEFTDDNSTENSIYKCTLTFSDKIGKNSKVLELINKKERT